MSYINGGEGEPEDDGGQDKVGKNPTGRKRKSSAGQRRKKDNKLFKGTPWARKKKEEGK